MGSWLGNLSLKYKFWAVNAVAFVTTLLLVLYAMQAEQQARVDTSRQAAQAQARLLAAWPADAVLPASDTLLTYNKGQTPTFNTLALPELADARDWVALNKPANDRLLGGAQIFTRSTGQQVAVLAFAPTFLQVFQDRFSHYAAAVFVLMLLMLCASQLLIRFLLSQLNALKDVMLHVEKAAIWRPACLTAVTMRSGRWPRRSMPCRLGISGWSIQFRKPQADSIRVPRIWLRA